jgi:hypothetical protein
MPSAFNTRTTHDLWIDARQFTITTSRPTPTTVQLDITYPTALTAADGAVVLFHDKPLSPGSYPEDGTQYVASTDFAAPADIIPTQGGFHVVGFYSAALGNPLPGVDVSGTSSFTITITNTDPNTLYYASVHAASNVLQYYPFGIQSYPLEGSRIEKDSSTYTGNIPSLPEPPTSPTLGMAYYDEGMNLVQYWTGSQWVATRTDAIVAGPFNPASPGMAYFYTMRSEVRIFDGAKWVTASPSNLQLLAPGPTWVPMTSVTSGTKLPDTPNVGDIFWNFTTQRGQYWDGVAWIYPTSANTLFNAPPLTPAFTTPFLLESDELMTPYVGQLFYNTTQKVLNGWTGSSWVQVNTDQEGTPSTDKNAIGNDGSYDERLRLIQVLKGELGWPVMCVELKEEQFNIAIDNALDTYRQLSDAAYKRAHILFTLIEGQQLYYLNSAVDKTDKIVSVNKIHRLNILGANSLNWDSNVYFQTFLNQYYSSGYTDILSIHLVHGLSEDFQRLFAGDMTFSWDEASRELFIARKIARNEKVIIEAFMERTEQELLLDRWCRQFLQGWALAECKMYLGLIRSKFSSGTPGANGPINLNGELLVSEARQDMTELREQLLNYEFGGLAGSGNVSFLIG